MPCLSKTCLDAGVSQASILGCIICLLYINDLLDDVICSTAIYGDYIVKINSIPDISWGLYMTNQ